MEIIIFLTVSPESHRTAEENLGIEYLASNLKKTLKYEIKIINGWIEKLSNEEIVEKILNYKNVLAIGVSSYLTDIENVKELLKIMKKLKLSKYYFAGGYGPTFSPFIFLFIFNLLKPFLLVILLFLFIFHAMKVHLPKLNQE